MAIRISGLVSGMDTDSIVQELVSAYSYKKDTYVKAQTKLSWKQDAWSSLNTKIYSLYTGISSLRYTDAYKLKTTSVSDSTKASVTAAKSAVNGTQTLQVKQLATAGYLTGGELSTTDGSSISDSTTLSSLGFSGTGNISVNGKQISLSESDSLSSVVNKLKDAGVSASLDTTNNRIFVSSKDSGTANEFTLTASDSAGATALQALGLNAASDSATAYYASQVASYAVFTDNAGNTYDATDYTIKHGDDGYYLADTDGNKVASYNEEATKAHVKSMMADGTLTASSYADADYTAAMKEYAYATQAQSGDTSVMDAYAEYLSAQTTMGLMEGTKYDSSLYESLNTMTEEDRTAVYYDENGKQVKITESEDEDGNTVYKDGDGNVLTKNDDGSYSYTTGEGDDKKTVTYVDGNAKLAEMQGYLDEKGITAEEYKEAVTTSSDFLADYKSDLTALKNVYDAYNAGDDGTALQNLIDNNLDTAADFMMENVTTNLEGATGTNQLTSNGAVRVNATDAEIVLNGATFTGASNTFNINGLTINALSTTAEGETLSITTSTDTQGLYDTVKDFLTQYNDLVNEMTSLYNASSAKGYEPLTSDEKDAMTDTQIEEWEEKIKSALLRRDSTLNGVLTGMTSAMSSSYLMGTDSAGNIVKFTANTNGTYAGDNGVTYTRTSNGNGQYTFTAEDGTTITGKSYSWSSFGISTLGYLNAATNEQNAYHIAGDEDDEYTSGNTDKLMAMINSDPDMVIEFMKNATSSLYKAIDNKMGSTTLSSIYKVYNDKEMAQEYSDYTETISKWEEKVQDMEDKYYKQFSAMETALATLQSQSSSLSGLLGS